MFVLSAAVIVIEEKVEYDYEHEQEHEVRVGAREVPRHYDSGIRPIIGYCSASNTVPVIGRDAGLTQ